MISSTFSLDILVDVCLKSYFIFCSIPNLPYRTWLMKNATCLWYLKGSTSLAVILSGIKYLRAILFVAISHFIKFIFGWWFSWVSERLIMILLGCAQIWSLCLILRVVESVLFLDWIFQLILLVYVLHVFTD